MAQARTSAEEFSRRVRAIPRFGLGLSVDVYSPDLFSLMEALALHDLSPAYLEIFKASSKALEIIRQGFPYMPLTYHGEGLWVTQPDFSTDPFFDQSLAESIAQADILRSHWLNHECAAKRMAGYSFGTYLPPLFTEKSARVVADNVRLVQQALDRSRSRQDTPPPLFLLEVPPLTYFSAGTIGVPEFFQVVTDRVACGLVLDLGHVWTVYRYTPIHKERSFDRFLSEFLQDFPLERVVEIHVAGLDAHEAVRTPRKQELPYWIDMHAAPIPEVLWTMLEEVLDNSRLTNLRAVALEVDTKPIECTVEEYREASRRCEDAVRSKMIGASTEVCEADPSRSEGTPVWASESDRTTLFEDYDNYAKVVSGRTSPSGSDWGAVLQDETGLDRYRHEYLPNEILHWGGALDQMFPDTCLALTRSGVALNDFVAWWFEPARISTQPYDFFLLKIERFVQFVHQRADAASPVAEREAILLRQAYAEANDAVQSLPSMEVN